MSRHQVPVSDIERKRLLDARREAKMTSSAHAYVRGSTHRFYEWLLSARGKSLPKAPAVWIDGDCHLGNIGPIARRDGRTDFEMRDLDQTTVGSPAHDVVRLSLSFAMAVRAAGLPGHIALRAVEAISRGYAGVLHGVAAGREVSLGEPPTQLTDLLKLAKHRSQHDLLMDRIGRNDEMLPIGKRFWPLRQEERAAVEALARTERFRKLVTGLASRDDDASVALLDAAYWVKGCSSLGLWRCAALVRVGKRKGSSVLSLIDIKEAAPACAPRSAKAALPKHEGERVVQGARVLAPYLGERMFSSTVLGHPVFVRELLPQDLKIELTSMSEREASAIAEYLARVVALGHARQLSKAKASRWLADFQRAPATHSSAPSWLWAAVVDLVALHEGAYLEHCRDNPPLRGDAAEQERDGDEESTRGEVQSHHVEEAAA